MTRSAETSSVSLVESAVVTQLPRPGDRVGRYLVAELIAQGGMAAVYIVRLEGTAGFSKLLAMKVMLPHLVGQSMFVNMFLDEARIASNIHHGNVSQVFEAGTHEGAPYLVMELLRGHSLQAVIKHAKSPPGPLPVGVSLKILADAARGLHAAHEARNEADEWLRVVHRDVSPHNIHVGYDGTTKVVDFGIARAIGRVTTTRTGQVKGKFAYLAPEQIDDASHVDRAVDIWAWSVVAWELLSGKKLFRDSSDASTLWNVMNRPIRSLRELNPAVPKEVNELILAGLNRDRSLRPKDCQLLADSLEKGRAASAASAAEVATLIQKMFERERSEERKRLLALSRTHSTPTERTLEAAELLAPAKSTTRLRPLLYAFLAASLGVAAWQFFAKSGSRDVATEKPLSAGASEEPSEPKLAANEALKRPSGEGDHSAEPQASLQVKTNANPTARFAEASPQTPPSAVKPKVTARPSSRRTAAEPTALPQSDPPTGKLRSSPY